MDIEPLPQQLPQQLAQLLPALFPDAENDDPNRNIDFVPKLRFVGFCSDRGIVWTSSWACQVRSMKRFDFYDRFGLGSWKPDQHPVWQPAAGPQDTENDTSSLAAIVLEGTDARRVIGCSKMTNAAQRCPTEFPPNQIFIQPYFRTG